MSGKGIKRAKNNEKYNKKDPVQFQENIISGLDRSGNDFKAISSFLENAGSKLDYRQHGECLFDILIAGCVLDPEGGISEGTDDPRSTNTCIFSASDKINMEEMKNWERVFTKLMQRYKYLDKIFQNEIRKILMMLNEFKQTDRKKLAAMLALWMAKGTVPLSSVLVLNSCHLVEDHLALDFLIGIFQHWRSQTDINSLKLAIRKANLEQHFSKFILNTNESRVYFKNALQENGLEEIFTQYEHQHLQSAKKVLQSLLTDALAQQKSLSYIITEIKEKAAECNIQEHQIICIIWTTIINIPDLLTDKEQAIDQFIRHLKPFTGLLSAFMKDTETEKVLWVEVQKFCSSNNTFKLAFGRITIFFYKRKLISKETIIKLYNREYSIKGIKKMLVGQITWFVKKLEENDFDEKNELKKGCKGVKISNNRKADPNKKVL